MDKQNICKYCGQVLMTDVECDCPEAKKARKIEDHIQRAKMAVTEMFGEQSKKEGYKPVSDDCIEIMFYAIEQIAYQKIHMASFVLPSGAKAKLTRGGKGSIKVERSETKKLQRLLRKGFKYEQIHIFYSFNNYAVGSAVGCAVNKDFKMAIYWIAAAVLNVCVTF